MTTERCPTCGATRRLYAGLSPEATYAACKDPWHATPTPETPDEREWFDAIRLVTGRSANGWHDLSQDQYEAADAAIEHVAFLLAELRAERDRLREALEADAADPCDAAAFYGEDGYDKCLDPEYNDMSGNPTLTRCYSCRARAALRSPENPEATPTKEDR